MNRFLYILSGNLSTTPRALQSIREAQKYNIVTIIGINRGQQWKNLDDQLVKEYEFNYRTISLGREHFWAWLQPSLVHKFYAFLYPIFKSFIFVNAYASSKVQWMLWKKLREESVEYDLIIGHSGCSLFPVWKFANRHHIPFISDVEDYYPGEYIGIDARRERQRREFLLQKLLPYASWITVASPLICERMKMLLGVGTFKNISVINNCFPSNEFDHAGESTGLPESDSFSPVSLLEPSAFNPDSSKIQFVWYSQNIASNRGLELIIPELVKIKEKVHLHLIGNLNAGFNRSWIEPNREFISTYFPMPQKELHRFICQFDVGLTLELSTIDENRQLCLPNKTWGYLQAGLFIVSTDTPAQVAFMKEHKDHGVVFPVDGSQPEKDAKGEALSSAGKALESILRDIEQIRLSKPQRRESAHAYSWEQECPKLQWIWDQLLDE